MKEDQTENTTFNSTTTLLEFFQLPLKFEQQNTQTTGFQWQLPVCSIYTDATVLLTSNSLQICSRWLTLKNNNATKKKLALKMQVTLGAKV